MMKDTRVVVLQGVDTKKLEEELALALKNNNQQPLSITQSQSAVPVIGSRMGWENVITITIVYPNA